MYVKKPEVIRDIKDKSEKRWVLKPSFFDSFQKTKSCENKPINNAIKIVLKFPDSVFIFAGIIVFKL